MKKRLISLIAILALALLIFASCGEKKLDFADKTYIYESIGYGGAFTIEIKSDETFIYREGMYTSIEGEGGWEYKNGILTLFNNIDEDDTTVTKNIFKVEDGCLVFVEEGSANFKYVTVADGEKFYDMSAGKAE